MAKFRFTNEHQTGSVGAISEILRKPRLWIPTQQDYPDFDNWLDKTEAQIEHGTKRAMLAIMGKQPVGTVIYQQHETLPNVVSIRNISVSPDAKGRYIGSFLLRNTEIEAIEQDFPDTNTVMVDTKITNTGMLRFLLSHDYEIAEVTDLYGLDTGLDAVLTKSGRN